MEEHPQINEHSATRGFGEDVMRYGEQTEMQPAIVEALEVLADADDLFSEDDAMSYFKGIVKVTNIDIDKLQKDPLIAELLQKKIEHNVKEEIRIWLEAEIEAGGETTPYKLKDVVRSRLANLHVREAVFSRVWDYLKQDLPVYYAKNFATQFKNRNEDDSFVAEILNVFSSDSIWSIIDGLKENEILFSAKFSLDDWQSVNCILDLRMSEFLKKRQTARKEVVDRLDKSKTKLRKLIAFCREFAVVDAVVLFGYSDEIEKNSDDMDKAVTKLIQKISTLEQELLRLEEQRNTFLQLVEQYQDAERNPRVKEEVKLKMKNFVYSKEWHSGAFFPQYPQDRNDILRQIDEQKQESQQKLRDYQEKLNRLQEVAPQFNELIQQHERELEQQRILDAKYKWSYNQQNSAIKELTTLADRLDGDSKAVANRLRSFARDIKT